MTPVRIRRMSSGGDLVSFVSRYAGGVFAAELATVMHVLDLGTGRKDRFDNKNPSYRRAATRDGARGRSMVDHAR